jgi:hypothetical protein
MAPSHIGRRMVTMKRVAPAEQPLIDSGGLADLSPDSNNIFGITGVSFRR